MRALSVVAASAILAVVVTGCSPSSRYDSTSSDAGVALVYHGDATRVFDERWYGSFEFNADGCLMVGLEGFDRPMVAALPAGSSLADDGTVVIGRSSFRLGEPIAFGRVTLNEYDSPSSTIPIECDANQEVFAVIDVGPRPAGA